METDRERGGRGGGGGGGGGGGRQSQRERRFIIHLQNIFQNIPQVPPLKLGIPSNLIAFNRTVFEV